MQKMNNNTFNYFHIVRSNFANIIKEVAYLEEVVLGSVDYIQALTLTDSVELLQSVIDKYIYISLVSCKSNYRATSILSPTFSNTHTTNKR